MKQSQSKHTHNINIKITIRIYSIIDRFKLEPLFQIIKISHPFDSILSFLNFFK